jgi:hypothetical protein
MFRRIRYVASRRKVANPKRIILRLLIRRHRIVGVPRELEEKLPRIRNLRRTIDSFSDEEIPLYFRFRNKEQLHRLMRGFRIPMQIKLPKTGNIFEGEEVLLIGLYRLHRPTTLSDGSFKLIFGMGHTAVSMAFNAFLDFMEDRWSYIIMDNLDFWLPYLPDCAQAIRNKCVEKGCYFPDARSPGGFRVAAFIDNTMNSTCRARWPRCTEERPPNPACVVLRLEEASRNEVSDYRYAKWHKLKRLGSYQRET